MKKFYLICLLTLLSFTTFAQLTPASNAIDIAPSLSFTSSVVNGTSVVYNPNLNLYYIIRAGNSTFPLETLSDAGVHLYQTTAGCDTRGMWWNSNTNQLERNGYSSNGWNTVNLGSTGHALNSFATIFPGQHQPDPQSVGAYDNQTNTVLFYAGGNTIFIYNRTTGTPAGSLTLTGTTFNNINTSTVIYTGQVGYELGLLDYATKRVLLFNRTTGAFSGACQLPNTAVTNSMFKFSYANNRVWLLNSANATWTGFWIWNIVMPTENLTLNANLLDNQNVNLTWKDENSANSVTSYELERSENSIDFSKINVQSPLANQADYTYLDSDAHDGKTYYRVKATYIDGTSTYSNIEIITKQVMEGEVFSAYPNPMQSQLTIEYQAETLATHTFLLYNQVGQVVQEIPFSTLESTKTINTEPLSAGVYYLKGGKKTIKLIKE